VRLQYTDTPTISYKPLEGAEFSNRVMTSISPTVLVSLAQAGWSVDRLLACCAQQINGVHNHNLQGTDIEFKPDTARFDRLLILLQRLQDMGKLRFTIEPVDGVATAVCYIADATPQVEHELREARDLLGYPREGAMRLRVTGNAVRTAPDELA